GACRVASADDVPRGRALERVDDVARTAAREVDQVGALEGCEPALVEGILASQDVDGFGLGAEPTEVTNPGLGPAARAGGLFEARGGRQHDDSRRRATHPLEQRAVDGFHLRQILPRTDQGNCTGVPDLGTAHDVHASYTGAQVW